MAQNNGSGNDAKTSSGQAAASGNAATTASSSKSPKSTHSNASAPSSGSSASPPGDLTSQQAAAIAAAAQAAQLANPAAASESAAASAGATAAFGTSSALSAQGNSSQNATDAETEGASFASEAAGSDGNATPGSLSGASNGTPQHMLSMGGRADSDGTLPSGDFDGARAGARSAAGNSTNATAASAFLSAERTAQNSEQSLFSSASDKLALASTSAASGTADATLAAAAASTAQVAGAAPAATTATVASASVPYPMGSDAWRADVSSHVLYFSQQDISSAQLHLNPAHLSPLNISISVDNNQTSIAFNAAHEATRQAMQDSLPQLRELFNAHGIALGQTTVGDSSAGSAQQHNQNSRPSGSSNGSVTSKALESSSTAPGGPNAVRLRSLQIVDTFA
jgi:flagellar hook-length control protein FliK